MNQFKNIGIFAHVDAGKTSLTEQLLYKSGAIRHMGRVDSGDTHTDTMELERERGISIMSTPTSYYYNKKKVNIIDTPGHVDFVAEVERSMYVLDGAILVISAKEGVQSHTKLLARTLSKIQVPTMIFINKIDRLGVNMNQVIEDIKNMLEVPCVMLQQVNNTGSKQCHVSSLYDIDPVNLINQLTEIDDDLMNRYLDQDGVSINDLRQSCQRLAHRRDIVPILCGSAIHDVGMEEALEGVDQLLPCFNVIDDEALGGIVFKVARDHVKVKECYVKVTSGRIALRDEIGQEKVTKINRLVNGHREVTQCVEAGDICVVVGLNQIGVGGVFGNCRKPDQLQLAKPTLRVNILPTRPSLRKQLLEALMIISEADPYMSFQLNELNNEIAITCFGYIQLEIIKETLKRKYQLDINISDPSTIYMETICKASRHQLSMKEDGHPYWAGIGYTIEPLPLGSGIVYEAKYNTGYLGQAYLNGIEDGAKAYLDQGLKGWEITDMKITFDYFEYEDCLTTPNAYRDLAPIIIFEAIKKARTRLLWPINNYRLEVPSDCIGKAIADIGAMKGTIGEPRLEGQNYVIEGQVPVEYSGKYHIDLQRYTAGQGQFEMHFHGYELAPDDLVKTRDKFKIDPSNKGAYLLHKLGGF